ncbi:hypothetical protein BGX21_006685 [Mortierella sp. AD011]|nr:hypothetical protein BGX20_006070 [Mortierella sp. AD010]KAF9403158.1 hypothetical protein BGX21_006685 [Mortierella sp. AD011]
MTTEAVIYVSLALVLLTRIYVFISPPEFLEEHKDRRYHEFHLYRQYHLHKQYDKSEFNQKRLPEDQNDDASSLHSSSSTPNTRRRPSEGEPLLDSLHHPSDELILLGSEPGAHPFPLRRLSIHSLSRLDPIDIPSPTSASTTPLSPKESGRGLWSRILGTSEPTSVPNYLSLDISEIHYNGSLKEFDSDPEVQASIQGLKSGVKDMTKECPTMTMVWECGRWCCLEGRTLYILRALEWKGQVRVRVLVDKDPMTLAVTEDYWKAAGMTSEFAPSTPLMSSTSLTPMTTSPATPDTPHLASWNLEGDDSAKKAHDNYIQLAAAAMDSSAVAYGPSLTNHTAQDLPANEPQARISLSTAGGLSLPASPTGHDADDEDDQGDDDDCEVESDGYLEDDEYDENDEEDIEKSVEALSLGPNQRNAVTPDYSERQKLTTGSQPRPNLFQPMSHRSKLTAIPSSPPSPIQVPNPSRNISFDPVISSQKNGPDSIGAVRQQRHYRERRISIPEFMLPPPLNDERAYLIIDPSLRTTNPPRRDSGHGVSP